MRSARTTRPSGSTQVSRGLAGLVLFGCALAVALPAEAFAAPVTVADRTRFTKDHQANITNGIAADDFTLPLLSYVQAADVWLSDEAVNDNGTLDGFSGQLNWAIYTTNGTAPGSLILAGRGVELVITDTGFQTQSGDDMVRVHFDLEPPVPLQAGTYWFAVHEGPWGTSDGTALDWAAESSNETAFGVLAPNVAAPTSWPIGTDRAFALYGGAYVTSSFDTDFNTTDDFGISDRVVADDFRVNEDLRLSGADVWLADHVLNNNGVLDSFSGTLGWAIYSDLAFFPGDLIVSGTDTQPRLVDTLAQDGFNCDIIHARIRFRGAAGVVLTAGPQYWFAMHEGPWGSSSDGSTVHWQMATEHQGDLAADTAAVASPSGWIPWNDDVTFALFADQIFSSGFEGSTACAWSNAPVEICF